MLQTHKATEEATRAAERTCSAPKYHYSNFPQCLAASRFLLMILLKSELKAKGCFPTALNFLLQCQMQELLGEGDKGAFPGISPWSWAVAALLPQWQQKTEWHKHTVINYWHSGRENSAGSKQGSGDPCNTWIMNFQWCCWCVIPGRATHRKSGSWILCTRGTSLHFHGEFMQPGCCQSFISAFQVGELVELLHLKSTCGETVLCEEVNKPMQKE